MPLTDYLEGLALFGFSIGAVAAATVLVSRRRLVGLHGEARALAIFLTATAALFLIHVLPLALGVLTPATPGVTGVVLCLALRRFLAFAPADGTAARPAAPASSRTAWVIAAIAGAAAAVGILAYTAAVALLPFTQVDVLNFHLPVVARWIQSGSLWQIDRFLAYQTQGNYPNTGDVVHLAAVLPWRADFAVRYVALPFVAATGVAVFALARELGAPAATALTYGAVAVTVPTVAVSNLDFELTDAIMYSTFAAGVLFLARHVRSRGRTDLMLAGVGLGLALGVKWYAVSAVAVVVLVWTAGCLLARRPWRGVVRDAGRVTGLIAALGGVWLVRNWVESGNPFFPVRARVLGVTVLDAPFDIGRDLAGFSLLDYADQPATLRRYAWPAFNRTLGLAWPVLAVGCAAVAARVLGRHRRRVDGRVLALVGCAALLALAYAATPYSALGGKDTPAQIGANTRYVVPALLLAAAATAWTAGRLGRAGIAVDLLGLGAVADGLRRGFTAVEATHWVAGVVTLGVAGAIVVLWRQARSRPGRAQHFRALAATGGVVALLAVATGGYFAQRRFAERRYAAPEAPLAWTRDHRHQRVGLAGMWDTNGLSPVLPSFGPRLGNDVEYVGPVRRGMLQEYAAAGPFAVALRRGRYELLVVGHATFPVPTGANGEYRGVALPAPAEVEAWARAAGYREVASSSRLVLFRAPRGRG
jgi:dolichyl-phosphate-mannose-protein mannosyltransferase